MSETLAPRTLSRPLIVVAVAAAVALGGTMVLWTYYGAAVFFETIRAGFAACFG